MSADEPHNPIKDRLAQKQLARRILGVTEDANDVEIKKAYWMRAMACHPDKRPNDKDAARRFQNIQNAYDALTKKTGRGLRLEEPDDEPGDERIGEYLSNDWGYFLWWRDAFIPGEGNTDKDNKR